MITQKPEGGNMQVLNNVLGIPVGSNTTYAYEKFLWKERDLNCNQCKNGMKSMIAKRINDKVYNIPVVCTCVPYTQSLDEDGVSIVVFKGRRERWVGGKRPEVYKHDEAVRSRANTAANNTRDGYERPEAVVTTKKFTFVRESNFVPQLESVSKSLPGAKLNKAPEIPFETLSGADVARPVFGDVTAKDLPKGAKLPQKKLQTLPNGTRVLVDEKTFSKLSGQPLAKSIKAKPLAPAPKPKTFPSTVEPVVVAPAKKRGRPAKKEAVSVEAGLPTLTQTELVGAVGEEKKKRGRPKKVVARIE